jgi:putative redox protein
MRKATRAAVMAEMRLTVRHTLEGDAMECATPQGSTIRFDGTDGPTKTGSPVQHLLASIGACALIDVNSILLKKRLEFSDLRVECVAKRPDEGTPKPLTDVMLVFHVTGDVPQKAMDDAVRLAVEKYCSVGATIRHGAPVHFESRVTAK